MRISAHTLGILSASGDLSAKAAMLAQNRLSLMKEQSAVVYDAVTDRFRVKVLVGTVAA